MIWLSAKKGIKPFADLPEFSAVFDEAIPLLGVQFLMMIVISFTAAFSLGRYFAWRARTDFTSPNSILSGPRLIVPPSLQLALAFSTAIGAILVLLAGGIQFFGGNYEDYVVGRLLAEINKYAIVVLVPPGWCDGTAASKTQTWVRYYPGCR